MPVVTDDGWEWFCYAAGKEVRMHLPHVNYLAVLVSAIAIFILGGLWYSKALFAKTWIALMGITEEQMKAKPSAPMPVLLLQALICSLLISWRPY